MLTAPHQNHSINLAGGSMKHETKFSAWLRHGGQNAFTLQFVTSPKYTKRESDVPSRLIEEIGDEALRISVERLNTFLPRNISIDISAVDTSRLSADLVARIEERAVGQDKIPEIDDPAIRAEIVRHAELLNGVFQRDGLSLTDYVWRSQDDSLVRSAHAENDDQIFAWDRPPPGGHPGEDFNCRCFAEPVIVDASFPEGAVCEILNEEMLTGLFPNAPDGRLRAIAEETDLQVVTGKLDSPDRLAHFFGQVRQEVGPRVSLEESLNYNASALPLIFSYFRRNSAEARRYGRTDAQPADQEAIANRVYANRIGNGDVTSGDGWRYRGRGLKQLTGRANYRAFAESHAALFGEVVDFEANPDLLSEPRYAVRSALFFWVSNGLYEIADQGATRQAADAITRIINRDTDSYDQRWQNVRRLDRDGTFADVCRFSVAAPSLERE